MKLINQINSRYGDTRNVYEISDGVYAVVGKSRYVRGAEGMVDFEGGPYIIEGIEVLDFVPGLSPDVVIKSVRWARDDEVINGLPTAVFTV